MNGSAAASRSNSTGSAAGVLEVENSLSRVATIARREGDAERASERYRSYFKATETQYRLGAASLLTLEDARRLVVSSDQSRVAAQLEQVQAWIALYKAVGGGWSDSAPSLSAQTSTTP